MSVYSPDGTRYDMFETSNTRFDVSKITDRFGNYATFTYGLVGGLKVLQSVSASDGRTITFNYSADVSPALRSITANGRTWTYSVTSVPSILGVSYRLNSVTPPTGNGWSYSYYGDRGALAGSYGLQSVTYPQGGTISYDYGWVTFLQGVVGVTQTAVVTSKATSDGTWTFAYQPTQSNGQYDVTTVTLPGGIGQITYKHFGYWTATEAWRVGLLYQKISGGTETETYSWEPQIISNEPFARFGYAYIDSKVVRPLLASVTRSRDGGSYSTGYSARDAFGNPQTISESGTHSRTTSKSYLNNSSAWIIGLSASEIVSGAVGSGTTSRQFDSATGNVTSETRFGVTTNFTYQPFGNIASRTDARGFTTTYSNYYRGVPQTEARPEGVAISRAVDYFGNVTQDGDGVSSWSYGYDALNRINAITFPAGSATSISWSSNSRTQTITRGTYTGYKYFDSYGRKVGENKGGIAISMVVDALGRTKFQSLPGSGAGATYSLDILGRTTSVSRPEGDSSFAYGSNYVTVTNARGISSTYYFYRYGDPAAGYSAGSTLPESTSISMTRDSLGLLTSVSQGGINRTYGYNANRYLTSMVHPETGTTTYVPDANGNMLQKTTGNTTATMTYDGLNRVKTATYPGTAGKISYGYNDRGQLISLVNPSATRSYEYDANGNLTLDSLLVDGKTFNTTYTWNGIDGLQSIIYPESRGTVTYAPNALGRPTQAAPFASSVSHFSSGNLSSVTFGNSIVQAYGEDGAQRPNAVGGPVQYGYTYDGMGNVTQITNPLDARTYTYDGADRLLTFSGQNGSGQFTYSTSGNINSLVQPNRIVNHFYDVNNRLSSSSGGLTRTYSYDTLGNITSDGTNNYTFDQSSMLTCSNCGTAKEAKYWYDGKGWRVMEERASGRTYLVYGLRGELLYEYAPNGKRWKKYAYVHGKHIATEVGSDAPASATALVASSATVQFGQQVTLTATVSPATTGTVTFSAGGVVLGSAPLVTNVATLNVTSLPVGVAAITASFSGSADFQPSVSPVASITVSKRGATAALTATPTTGLLGQTVVLNVSVTGASPTGQVEIRVNGVTISTQSLINGALTVNSSLVNAGTTSFTVNYLGDAQNTAAVSNVATVTISKALPVMALQTSAALITYGSTLVLSAQPTPVANIPVTGTVTFKNGTATLGAATLAGNAVFTTSILPAGTYAITRVS
jgi:YD repeat-containing protein